MLFHKILKWKQSTVNTPRILTGDLWNGKLHSIDVNDSESLMGEFMRKCHDEMKWIVQPIWWDKLTHAYGSERRNHRNLPGGGWISLLNYFSIWDVLYFRAGRDLDISLAVSKWSGSASMRGGVVKKVFLVFWLKWENWMAYYLSRHGHVIVETWNNWSQVIGMGILIQYFN